MLLLITRPARGNPSDRFHSPLVQAASLDGTPVPYIKIYAVVLDGFYLAMGAENRQENQSD